MKGHLKNDLRELERRTFRRGEGEVPARPPLYRTENIGRAAARASAANLVVTQGADAQGR
jgi:hypothetical protein